MAERSNAEKEPLAGIERGAAIVEHEVVLVGGKMATPAVSLFA